MNANSLLPWPSNQVTVFPLPSAFGVIYSRYLLEEKASSTMAAWIFNLECSLWHISGPFIRPLTQEFGWRRTAFVGCFLVSSSLVLTAFTPSPEFLFFSASVLCGVCLLSSDYVVGC